MSRRKSKFYEAAAAAVTNNAAASKNRTVAHVPEPTTTVVPRREHAFYNGPVCIGPPDGAVEFDDRGVEEQNVLHGPLNVRGKITLDSAAAVSLFHQLYEKSSGGEAAPRDRSLDSTKDSSSLWDGVEERFQKLFGRKADEIAADQQAVQQSTAADRQREAAEQQSRLEELARRCAREEGERILRQGQLQQDENLAHAPRKRRVLFVARSGLEWDPSRDYGVRPPAGTPEKRIAISVGWKAHLLGPSQNPCGETIRDSFLCAANVDDGTLVFEPTKSPSSAACAVRAVRFRGKVSFGYPDPVGHRSLWVIRDGKRFLAATAAAVPTRRGTSPTSLSFDLQIPLDTAGKKGAAFKLELQRLPAGPLWLVATDTHLAVSWIENPISN